MTFIKAEQLSDIAEKHTVQFQSLLQLADEPEDTAYSLILQSIYRRVVNAAVEGDYFVYVPIDLFMRAERAVTGSRCAVAMVERVRNDLFRQNIHCKFAVEVQQLYIRWG